MNNPFIQSFVFLDTDSNEIERLIMELKNSSSVGWDLIPIRLLKEFKDILIPPLTYMLQKCIRDGIFPEVLKKSVIIPIHKSGRGDCIENFRPISLLPAISKLLEKIINVRLVKYLEQNNLLSKNQFGFRVGKSADEAVHELTDWIVKNLDSGKKTLGIFIDLAKAFDTVSLQILQHKLEIMGIRGTELKLLSDYLNNRYQCVKIDKHFSEDLAITHGIPQGSILGPTLFLI